jgi:hypothetical protein
MDDIMSDGWQVWLDWQQTICPDNDTEIKTVEADRGSYLGYIRLVGRRRAEAKLEEPIVSIPTQYTQKPLCSVPRNGDPRSGTVCLAG